MSRSYRYWLPALGLATVGVTALNFITGWAPSRQSLRTRLGHPIHSPADGGSQVRRLTLPVDPAWRIPRPHVWVYTPAGFDLTGQTAYPVVYLLHGSPSDAADWFATGAADTLDHLIAHRTIPPLIAVAPDLNAYGTWESSGLDFPGGSQTETFFRHVRRWARANLPIAHDRRQTAFIGLSMGAQIALDQGIRQADEVGMIGALAPYGDPGHGKGCQRVSAAQFQAHSPDAYIPTIPTLDAFPVAFFLCHSEAEANRATGRNTRRLAAALQARHQDVDVAMEPGQGHTLWFAQAALPDALRFWARRMGSEVISAPRST